MKRVKNKLNQIIFVEVVEGQKEVLKAVLAKGEVTTEDYTLDLRVKERAGFIEVRDIIEDVKKEDVQVEEVVSKRKVRRKQKEESTEDFDLLLGGVVKEIDKDSWIEGDIQNFESNKEG